MKKKYSIEKINETNDLEYLSSVAFESFLASDADIDFLKTKIDKKISFSSSQFYTIFISLLIGLFIGISVFFVIFQKQKNHPSINNLNENNETKKTLNNSIAKTDTIFPEIKLSATIKTDEHFTSSETNQEELIKIKSPEILEAKKMFLEENVQENYDIVFEFSPNAPVIFIHNFKVTNYRSYYFKHNEAVNLSLNEGLSAQFENNSNSDKTRLSKSNGYLAHKIIQNAMWLFNTKKTQNCIEELTLLYDFNNNDANAQFYLGMCYFQNGKYNYGINFFNKNLDNENNIFHQESEYYLALCCINTNEKEKGISILNQIIKNKGFYSKRARETLLNLEKK